MSWRDVFSQTLETDRVTLRPLLISDRGALSEIAFDPSIWKYFVTRVETPEDIDTFIETGLADIAARRRAVFIVCDRSSGRIAGSMCYGNFAEIDRRLEIGWSWLGADFRGTGLNGHAKFALLSHAFETLDCERVEFKTDVLNEVARRGLIKIGVREEGVLRSYNFMPGGRRRDAIYYSILRAEWPGVKEELHRLNAGLING